MLSPKAQGDYHLQNLQSQFHTLSRTDHTEKY